MNKRMKEIRKRLNMNQHEFGNALGIGRDAVSNIELNRTDVKEPIIKLVCKQFNINEDWLRNGHGEMFLSNTIEDDLAVWAGNLVRESGIEDGFMKQFVHMLSKLDVNDWKVLEKMAILLNKDNNN